MCQRHGGSYSNPRSCRAGFIHNSKDFVDRVRSGPFTNCWGSFADGTPQSHTCTRPSNRRDRPIQASRTRQEEPRRNDVPKKGCCSLYQTPPDKGRKKGGVRESCCIMHCESFPHKKHASRTRHAGSCKQTHRRVPPEVSTPRSWSNCTSTIRPRFGRRVGGKRNALIVWSLEVYQHG